MKQYFVHPHAIVDTEKIGSQTKIWAFTHILKGAQIGRNCNICDYVYIENNVSIGNNVTIKNGVYLWDGITIQDDVFIGPGVVFTNDSYPRSKNKNYIQKKTYLKKGSSIGANSTILPGITIGNYAMIGAGSLVSQSIPDFTLAFGNPAQFRSYICICGKKFDFGLETIFTCSCKNTFKKINNGIKLIYPKTP